MKKFKKMLLATLLVSSTIMSATTTVFASTTNGLVPVERTYATPVPGVTVDNEDISTKAWWPDQYIVKNKTYQKQVRYITKYITPNWSKASSYSLQKGESTTYGLNISGSKDFKAGIKASGSFTASKTFSSRVTTTIPADPNRYSKLTYQCDYDRYYCDLYKIPAHNDNIPQPPTQYVGSDYVDEPTDATYAIVVYQ